ncbi:hypothetical protein EDD18DRAFT_1106327 [Armillaria luteobubalina]|uniref:Phosphoribosylaminoimidazole-succinocarboxamide synthase n=1 Tax=Armillaria luteobubalina TaxID=153913 RepID=A0AA39Q5K1_9AGAR|nr:hypothetical protein EDD18DRAFT_1106327 [Armillaria luteobubalina]
MALGWHSAVSMADKDNNGKAHTSVLGNNKNVDEVEVLNLQFLPAYPAHTTMNTSPILLKGTRAVLYLGGFDRAFLEAFSKSTIISELVGPKGTNMAARALGVVSSGCPDESQTKSRKKEHESTFNLFCVALTSNFQGIPDKNKLPTKVSLFWFEKLAHIIPNHFVTGDIDLEGHTMLVKKAKDILLEAIVRGYLTGCHLWFHISKIESMSSHRQGARNSMVGGDDNIPYRKRRKKKGKCTIEEAQEDADGYYKLVKKKAQDKKEKRKAEHEA